MSSDPDRRCPAGLRRRDRPTPWPSRTSTSRPPACRGGQWRPLSFCAGTGCRPRWGQRRHPARWRGRPPAV